MDKTENIANFAVKLKTLSLMKNKITTILEDRA